MAINTQTMQMATAALVAGDAQIQRQYDLDLRRVITFHATGTGDIDQTFKLDDVAYLLIFARCHFTGGAGSAAMRISVDSGQGAAYDCDLYRVLAVGTGADMNLRLGAAEVASPAAWSFRPDDAVRFQWTNPAPGATTWGLEVGLAIA